MTTGDINEIYEWWTKHSSVTNFLANIITNTEALAELKTNTFEIIEADRMLDNESVWTNGAATVEVKGFKRAPLDTVPVKSMGERGGELKWKHLARPDSEVEIGMGYDEILHYNRSLIRQDDYGMWANASNVWSLHGFEYASDGEVPYAHIDEYGNKELKWRLSGNAVRVVGTDGSEAVMGVASRTNTLTFASAPDSNVMATVVGDVEGNITVTFGVYYLQESNLNGSSGGGSGL
jgi:hypothetical protein